MIFRFRFCWYLSAILLFLASALTSCSLAAVVVTQQQQIRIGTRPSPLARQQAQTVAQVLQEVDSSITTELVLIDSASEIKSTPITQAKPLAMSSTDFCSTVDNAIISRKVDIGVHSLKDVPPNHRWRSDLRIACHLPRASCSLDVLIGATSLQSLPANARVGSASVRRQAQLLAIRPDIIPVNLRGNVQTRLQALEEGMVDALVLARAGLERLNIKLQQPYCVLSSEQVLPAPAQGIVGVVCHCDDKEMLKLLGRVDDRDARMAATAERTVLNVVDDLAPWDGRPPVAAYMEPSANNSSWVLHCLLARPDGQHVLRTERRFPRDASLQEATLFAREAGEELLNKAGLAFFDENLQNVDIR